jgi:hypothetical protein
LATRQELGSKFGGRLNCGFTCFAKVAAVALANKIARMAWRSFRSDKWFLQLAGG